MPEHAVAPRLPDRVTMPLLSLITQQSMDEDYLHVAQRRAERAAEAAEAAERAAGQPGEQDAAQQAPPSRSGPHRRAAVVVAVFGLLVATAAVQTSRNASVDDAGRASLITQINDRKDEVSSLQERIVADRERNVGLEQRLAQVTSSEQAAQTRLQRLEARTGYGATTGDGIRVSVDDNPVGDASQRVRDTDLRKLVDGLWVAGAEAVSINGHRLTALSAIRNAGAAIHVNSDPLTPPYVVSAVGDQRTLQARLLDSTLGGQFFTLAQQLGFVYSMRNEDSMSLPAARSPRLHWVEPASAAQHQQKLGGTEP